MKKIVFSECPYCKSTDIALGFQLEKGAAFADIRGGVFGSQIEHTICKECGSIIYSHVLKPEIFKQVKNTADFEFSPSEVIEGTTDKPVVELPSAEAVEDAAEKTPEPPKAQIFMAKK